MVEIPLEQSSPPGMSYCWEILPHVSRTFALTIPVLEEPLRDQVGLSYLLCRIVDTVEDRGDLDPARRDALFGLLHRLACEPGDQPARREFLDRWPVHPDPHHESLVRHTGEILDCYASLPGEPRAATEACVREMIQGMNAFPVAGDDGEPVEACRDLDELERYCHAVAGTVGILLSRLFAAAIDDPQWLNPERVEFGRRFGLGLQLTNILKDHVRDMERGVTYIPYRWLQRGDRGFEMTAEGNRVIVERALEHMDAAEAYILSLPRRRPDMRLFCLWAQHLAMATLFLAAERGRDPGAVKVSREDLRSILGRAERHVEDDRSLEFIYRGYRDAVTTALARA